MSKTKNGGSEFVHIAYVFHIEASTPSDYINMIQIVLFPHQAQITKRMNLVTLLVCNLLCVSLTLGQGVYRLKFPALVVTGRESVGTTVVNYDFLVGNTGQYGDLGEFFYDGEPYYCWNSTDSQPLSCSSSSSLLISTQNVTISHPDEDGTVYAYAERDGGLLGRFTVGSVSADWPQWAVIVYSTSSSAHPSSWYVDDNKLKLTSGLGPNNSTTLQACYFTQSSGRDRYAISLEGSPAYTGQVSCQATEFDLEFIPPSADTTSIWDGSYTTWTTDSNGIVVEQIPTPSADTTSIWTGSETSWTTDSDGTVIELVPTPSADATSIWTGDHTTWTTDSEGNVIEQIPTPSADTTSIWTGDHTTWTTEVGGDGSSIVVELVPSETGTATNVVQTPVPSSGISDGVSALDGFNVEVFHYPADNYELANEISFLSYGYENLGLVTTATGVSDINFDTDSNWPSYIDRNALGNTGSYVNATIKYEGFFRAPVDGDYEFSFSNIDYNSILFVGSAAADQALRKREAQFLKPETSPNHILFFNNSRDVGQTISTTQYLSADSYYPLRVVIAAVSQHALLDFQIKLPNGVSLTQFQGYVYNFALEGAESTTVIGDKTSTWTGTYTTWTTDSEGSTIVLCPSIISDHNGKPADTTLTDGSISTTVVTVTSCDIKKCTKTTALTGVTQKTLTVKGTTTVVTAYCPLPTDVATVKTISVGGSEVLQTVYTAKPSHIVPDVQTLTVTITREVCDALTCIPATIVTGEILKTTTLADTHSTTVIPVYVPLETHQPALDLITLETVLKSSDFANGPAITSVSVESLSHQSGVVVSEFDSDSTSGAVSQPSSAVSLQTGKASALKWSPFLGAAVISLFNVFFV
ncbi:Putative flocculin [Komagataella phaffii CBS 7435]|uniref:Putative flocculin n=1 Tax=Komagataella phaffii (strain ATCC 76273 / CBS 7435 / CECT 11047 / NRRL Y-11430 / Wegner 21-1) TaxID=981350 RepID=F2R0I4_KOMPC|nr:Putative flocculin [Komagataella phaffii CBS 7435]